MGKHRSKYLGRTYCGYKVTSVYVNLSNHSYYTLRRLRKVLVIDGNKMVALARHETTVKKLLGK